MVDTPPKEQRLVKSPIDGMSRTVKQEQQLNAIAAAIFREGGGKTFLDYLRSITLNRIMQPSATDAELRSQEGSRILFGIIQQRVTAGQKGPHRNVVQPEKPSHD